MMDDYVPPTIPKDLAEMRAEMNATRLEAREKNAHAAYSAGDIDRIAAAHAKRQRKADKRRKQCEASANASS